MSDTRRAIIALLYGCGFAMQLVSLAALFNMALNKDWRGSTIGHDEPPPPTIPRSREDAARRWRYMHTRDFWRRFWAEIHPYLFLSLALLCELFATLLWLYS